MPLTLYNTLTRRVEPFVPIDPAHVTFYSCGPTVYDDAHIGNFRSFLAADVLRRWVESPLCGVTDGTGSAVAAPGGHAGDGRLVTHVMNITDVGHMTDDAEGGEAGEDRMAVAGRRLEEAKKSGKLPPGTAGSIDPSDPYAIAAFYAARFLEDARKLGLKVAREAERDPTLMPRPTQKIAGMIAMVQSLIAKGHAYAVGHPGSQTVYFSVQTFPAYGRLSGNTLEALRTGAGGRVQDSNQSEKRHPADFLLWKADPAHVMKWPSPWGEGYPGWHLECSVMAFERLVGGNWGSGSRDSGRAGSSQSLIPHPQSPLPYPEIDLHSGGEDNIFPHHECELAQSVCVAGGGTFARMWFHPRHLFVEGEKMSKSKGNFFTARDLFAKGHEPAALRLELIKTHYRSNANFTEQGLKSSGQTIERWIRALAAIRAADEAGKGSAFTAATLAELRATAIDPFVKAMDDDLNVAEAIARFGAGLRGAAAVFGEAEGAGGGAGGAGGSAGGAGSADLSRAHAALSPSYLWRDKKLSEFMRAVRAMAAAVGVFDVARLEAAKTEIGVFVGGLAPDPAVVAKLEERRSARAGKDFKRSDAIRDELLAMGYAIKDVAGGRVEVSRAG